MRKPSLPVLVLSAMTAMQACGDPDLSDTKPDRTRDADGIVKLYRNHEQGDWMLKGKVILVRNAVVLDVPKSGSAFTLAGQTTLSPIPITLRFHVSEKQMSRLTPGDLIAFKGICTGMTESIQFRSGVLMSVSKPLSLP
ncbi:MAG: hypothetical protein CL902_03050 [Dehalococcoidia bacterium]|nr:hypothetical protein [Dehalococcoidia bacterium]